MLSSAPAPSDLSVLLNPKDEANLLLQKKSASLYQ
jgi:hypothetical protein